MIINYYKYFYSFHYLSQFYLYFNIVINNNVTFCYLFQFCLYFNIIITFYLFLQFISIIF